MKASINNIMRLAEEQGALLCAAQKLLAEPARDARRARLCLCASLLLLLMLVPTQCAALRF